MYVHAMMYQPNEKISIPYLKVANFIKGNPKSNCEQPIFDEPYPKLLQAFNAKSGLEKITPYWSTMYKTELTKKFKYCNC